MARSVSFFSDSEELGGAEQALLLLLENLDHHRWEPTLLYTNAALTPLAECARELGARTRRVPPMPLGLAGARRLPAFAADLRRTRPHVFHAHMSWPLAAKYALAGAILARVPAIVGTVQLFPEFRVDRSNHLQMRLLAAGVGRFIAVSNDIARRLVSTLSWPQRRIEVIHNGVPVDRIQVEADPDLRRQLSGGDNRSLVLTAARLDPQKGLDVLIRAAVQVPDTRFVIAGEGSERTALETQAQALGVGDRILFLGHRTDVPALLAASDVFALPSLYEGSSLAVLEAMAAQKPVVTSAISGTDELVVDGRSGLLVPAGDADALAGALRRVLSEPALRARLASEARTRAETRFSASANAKRVARIYDVLLGGGVTPDDD